MTLFATKLTEMLTAKVQVIGKEIEKEVALRTADAILTKAEVAKHFQITERTLENWMKAGYVPYFRFGRAVRFSLAEVQRHVEKHRRVCRLRI